MRRVLFLCTGNYYRSRYCEAIFAAEAKRRGVDWRAFSRGLWRGPSPHERPLSSHTHDALASRRIAYAEAGRMPRRAMEGDFEAAAHIVAVNEREHRPEIELRFPAWRHRVEHWTVDDVDRLDAADALPRLERQVTALLVRLERGICAA
ncbi:MAG: low molecular weight phosphatase family protein [Myxococcota bacterium]